MSNERTWIGEIGGRFQQTVLVTAATRKEAEYKLRMRIDVQAIDTIHTGGVGRIIREDNGKNPAKGTNHEAK